MANYLNSHFEHTPVHLFKSSRGHLLLVAPPPVHRQDKLQKKKLIILNMRLDGI